MKDTDVRQGTLALMVLKTLGLSLRRVRAPLEVLVVDSIDRTPTDN